MVTPNARRLADRYEVRSLIGRGGMAEVHLGFDTRLSRVVAIKMLRVDLARDNVFQARFHREAQASASLNHPNIVGVYDTGAEPVMGADGKSVSVPYIVMEYVEGHTVRELLSDGTPVPIAEAVEITSGILSALEYSHAAGLVHRDIKPGNVMLTNEGKVKVMDFGIARAMADSQATMTATNAVVGTAQYLSPEQARGEQVDARSDIYSTGCVLFELLTGRPPFRGDSAVAVAYQHVSEVAPAPSTFAGDIPESLDRVTMKAMAKVPDSRYSSATLMRIDLNRAFSGHPVDAPAIGAWGTAGATVVNGPAATATAATLPMGGFEPTRAYAGPMRSAQTGAAYSPNVTQTAMAPVGEEESPKSKKALWISLILVLALILVGVGTFLALNGNKAVDPVLVPTTVPTDLIGLSQAEAIDILTNAKLGYTIAKERAYDATIPAGSVVLTDPIGGAPINEGEKVTLTLSKGAEAVKVPDLAGKTQQEATEILTGLGLEVGDVSMQEDTSQPVGKVISTNPVKGSEVPAGGKVNLVVSSGSKIFIPTNLVGMTQQEATNALQALGLVVGEIIFDDNPAQPANKVLGSDPVAGVEVVAGDTVNLTISSGNVIIPDDLVGQPQKDVLGILADLKLNTTVVPAEDSTVPAGMVISLSQSGIVPQGGNVTVTVSTGPAPVASPSPTGTP